MHPMRKIAVDSNVVTEHTATINGQAINYSATAGTMPVWDDMGKPVASLFYTYYKRKMDGNLADRPLVISFNGGPGSASVWMHIAYTGPKVVKIDEEGYPQQPYGIQDNPHSILDVADIVFVNPVNTGYSRPIVAEGEEVDRQWMYLNGVIMVSPADYKSYGADNALSSALNIPYMAAAAWHHKVLPDDLQSKDLLEVLPEVEAFAVDELLPALAKGGFISEAERMAVAEKMARRKYYNTIWTCRPVIFGRSCCEMRRA